MVPILLYHQVSDVAAPGYRRYTVSPRRFAVQMRVLSALGYQTISLAQLLHGRTYGIALPPRPVVITFDDGFADAIRHAVPILERLRMTATFFVVAGLVGRTSEWTRRSRRLEMPLADAGRLRAIADAGFGVGSHTVTHRRLAELEDYDCRSELRGSKRRLEDLLGREVVELAYPFGSVDERVRQAAAECGYVRGCSIEKGLSAGNDDPMRLPRVQVIGGESMADFVARIVTGHPVRESVRSIIRPHRPGHAVSACDAP